MSDTEKQSAGDGSDSTDLFSVAFGAFTTINEYGQSYKCLGWYSTEEAAEKKAANQGRYGGNGNVVECPTVEVEGKVYLLKDTTPIKVDDRDEKAEAAKEAVLAKLSPEDRKALGYFEAERQW